MKTQVQIDYKAYFNNALSFEAYKEAFQIEMENGSSKYAKYLPQNWQRQSRLERKFKLTPELIQALGSTQNKRKWLVITEHWCGDAAQINPIIYKIAEASEGVIDLRFTYRDVNEELIDAHLTNGSRSIPILIEMTEDFKVLKTYGPRPDEAQEIVLDLLAKKESYSIPLHTWYAKDKQNALKRDFVKFLSA